MVAVKTAQNGICVIGVAGILDNLCSCKRHVIRDGQNCVYAVRVLLDNRLHSGGCLVRHGVGVLHFEHLTACGFDRIAVAAQTCFMGLVALYACDLNALDIGPAGCLCSFNSGLAALLGCFLVAGADECEALVGINAGIVCYDRLVGVCDSGCNSLGLQRSDQVAIVGLNRKVGLNGVELLLVVGLSRRTLDVQADLIRVLILICLSACLNNVLELGSVGLEHHADLVRAVMGGGGVAAVVCCRRWLPPQAVRLSARALVSRAANSLFFIVSLPFFSRFFSCLSFSTVRLCALCCLCAYYSERVRECQQAICLCENR